MPKRDAPRARTNTAIGHARRKRSLRNPSPVPVSEPQPHHGVSTNLELPAWLPPPVVSYARKINRQTLADKPLLCRLTSDPRMRGVWTELLKRKRSNYKKHGSFHTHGKRFNGLEPNGESAAPTGADPAPNVRPRQ